MYKRQGSTFALYLPYQEIPVEVAERSLSTKIDSESVRHKKILVVEDIESNFDQLNILLKKEYTIPVSYTHLCESNSSISFLFIIDIF